MFILPPTTTLKVLTTPATGTVSTNASLLIFRVGPAAGENALLLGTVTNSFIATRLAYSSPSLNMLEWRWIGKV